MLNGWRTADRPSWGMLTLLKAILCVVPDLTTTAPSKPVYSCMRLSLDTLGQAGQRHARMGQARPPHAPAGRAHARAGPARNPFRPARAPSPPQPPPQAAPPRFRGKTRDADMLEWDHRPFCCPPTGAFRSGGTMPTDSSHAQSQHFSTANPNVTSGLGLAARKDPGAEPLKLHRQSPKTVTAVIRPLLLVRAGPLTFPRRIAGHPHA